jgi:dienelactone hydrolase
MADMTEDLRTTDVPTLILENDDDQIVPVAASGMPSAKLIKNATLKIYKGAAHGLCKAAASYQAIPPDMTVHLTACVAAQVLSNDQRHVPARDDRALGHVALPERGAQLASTEDPKTTQQR